MWRSAVQVCLGLLQISIAGGLAQLARAPALHAGGQRFESVILHIALFFLQGSFIDILYTRKTKARNFISVLEQSSLTVRPCNPHDGRCGSVFSLPADESRQGQTVDALALEGDEGRGKLR